MTYNILHVKAHENGTEDVIRVATTKNPEFARELQVELQAIARPGETYEIREEEDG
ncbi:MAG: hypothetical protein LUE22_00785 [Oscillospiraceae bacterium]|nr:hypothetical protein [Oscillospiraceae bacterium]